MEGGRRRLAWPGVAAASGGRSSRSSVFMKNPTGTEGGLGGNQAGKEALGSPERGWGWRKCRAERGSKMGVGDPHDSQGAPTELRLGSASD